MTINFAANVKIIKRKSKEKHNFFAILYAKVDLWVGYEKYTRTIWL